VRKAVLDKSNRKVAAVAVEYYKTLFSPRLRACKAVKHLLKLGKPKGVVSLS